jgi:hypothetical protein
MLLFFYLDFMSTGVRLWVAKTNSSGKFLEKISRGGRNFWLRVRFCTSAQQARKVIGLPQLCFLHVTHAHVDYATQSLVDERCQLPRLQSLHISWPLLMAVTHDCTNAATRSTCSRLKFLCIREPYVRPAYFHKYFASLWLLSLGWRWRWRAWTFERE